MRTLLLLGLVLALALAGCSSPPPAAPTGKATTSVAPTALATSSAPHPVVRVVTTPFAVDGQTATGGCAFAATVGYCQFPAGHDSFKALEGPGVAKAVHMNATWTPTVPAQPQVYVYLLHLEGAPQGGTAWYWRMGDPVASGPSPLQIDWALNGTASGYALSVEHETYEGAGDAGAVVDTPQDFHLAGAVVSEER